jgi:hypothetical protein
MMGWLKDREIEAATRSILERFSSGRATWEALAELQRHFHIADMNRRLPNGRRVPGWTAVTSRQFAFLTSRGLAKSPRKWADGDLQVDLVNVPHIAVSPPATRLPWKGEYKVAEIHRPGLGVLRVFSGEESWADFELRDGLNHHTFVAHLDQGICGADPA